MTKSLKQLRFVFHFKVNILLIKTVSRDIFLTQNSIGSYVFYRTVYQITISKRYKLEAF